MHVKQMLEQFIFEPRCILLDRPEELTCLIRNREAKAMAASHSVGALGVDPVDLVPFVRCTLSCFRRPAQITRY